MLEKYSDGVFDTCLYAVFKITGFRSNCRLIPGIVSILHSGILEKLVKENMAILTGSVDSGWRLQESGDTTTLRRRHRNDISVYSGLKRSVLKKEAGSILLLGTTGPSPGTIENEMNNCIPP
jgi:hypothetical protein